MYLLDTNVLSELRKQPKRRSDPRVAAWSKTVPLHSLYVSVVTVHEIEFGIRLVERIDSVKASILRAWLTGFVLPAFAERVVSVDVPCVLRSAELHAVRTRNWQDALIAATAFIHDFVLVTRNVSHFTDCGVALLNPWEA